MSCSTSHIESATAAAGYVVILEKKKAPNWAKLKPCRYILAYAWITRQKHQQSILSAFMATHAHNASWKRHYRLLALKIFIFPAPAIIFPVWINSWVTSGELLSTVALQIRPWTRSHLGLFSWSFKLGCWWIDTNYPLLYVTMLAPMDFLIVVRDACSKLLFTGGEWGDEYEGSCPPDREDYPCFSTQEIWLNERSFVARFSVVICCYTYLLIFLPL